MQFWLVLSAGFSPCIWVASSQPLNDPAVPQNAPPMPNCKPEDQVASQLPTPVGNPATDAAIFAAQDELKWLIAHPDAGIGATANPPTSGCPPQPDAGSLAIGTGKNGEGCTYADKRQIPLDRGTTRECTSDQECQSQFGASYLCREIMDVATCPATLQPGTDARCAEHAWCVSVDCSGLVLPGDNNPCDEINICNPGTEQDAGVDPDTRWDPPAFDPGTLFPGGKVPNASPSTTFEQDPTPGQADAGVDHPWCKFTTQNPQFPVADQPGNGSPSAKTDQSKAISLSFDPNLTFNIDAKPLALGETNLKITAGASMGATVKINSFMGMPAMEKTVLYAGASIVLERCNFRTDDTKLELFGLYVPIDDYVPIINSSINPADDPDGTKHSNATLYKASWGSGSVSSMRYR